MISAELPHNEVDRLKNLYSYCILDSEKEEDFDAITTLAAQIFKVPICVITLLDKERQWFKSKVGIEINETPRNISFCGHAILTQNELMVVKNAHDDIRFKDNPLVVCDCKSDCCLKFCGVMLANVGGRIFGTTVKPASESPAPSRRAMAAKASASRPPTTASTRSSSLWARATSAKTTGAPARPSGAATAARLARSARSASVVVVAHGSRFPGWSIY